MPRKGHSEEQIVYALRQIEGGKKVSEVCREMGVSPQAVYRLRRPIETTALAEEALRPKLTADKPNRVFPLTARVELVAGAAHGQKVARAGGIRLEFLPKAQNMIVDDARRGIVLIILVSTDFIQ